MQRSKQRNGVVALFLGLACTVVAVLPGCSKGISGTRNRIDELAPGAFFRTAEMVRPRYEHRGNTLDDGTVFVNGGSDERTFTSIDLCELFDQKLVVEPEPPSLSGGWISTDFEGEDLRLQDGGRVFHTSTRMSEGNVLVIGGAPDAVVGEAYVHPEFYDRHTRKFTVLTAALEYPRFHHTTVPVTEGEFFVIGGQIGIQMTIVDPQYPPNDPRFIQDINTNPSTNTIEVFDSSLVSDDGYGDFMLLRDGNDVQVKLPTVYGRSLHATVRIAGLDNALDNAGDMFISVAGVQTMSPLFAPRTKLRRAQQGESALQTTMDIYDGFTKTCFTAPGVFMEVPRAHGVQAENLGWRGDLTIDGFHGMSNTFLVFGGSDDTYPTTGAYLSEGYSAYYSGFGPGGGIQLIRLEPQAGETLDGVIADTLNAEANLPLLAFLRGTPIAPGPFGVLAEGRFGKYFCNEVALNGAYSWPINRVHTESVHVLRNVYTNYGLQTLGNLFIGAGGWFYVVMGAQVEVYDGAPVASAEYFDPCYNLVNGFFVPPHNPYDLTTMRTYWHVKLDVELPTPEDNNRHPNPGGLDGAWLITDGFVPGDGFEGSQFVMTDPVFDDMGNLVSGWPNTDSADDLMVRVMEKGRGWNTVNLLPGANGLIGDADDRILFAGGGEGVAIYGGMPVVPSAMLYVPPLSR